MTVTSLLILERGFQGLKTHCRAASGGRKGVSCTGSLPCTRQGRKHPRAALSGHSGFAVISWHARTLFPQTSLGKLLVHASTRDYRGPSPSFLQPSFPQLPCSHMLPPPPKGTATSSPPQDAASHTLSLGRAVTSPAASRSHTWQGREEKTAWGRGPQAFHSSYRVNLIYRHRKMQLKWELK